MQKIPLDKSYMDQLLNRSVLCFFVCKNKNKNVKIKIGLKDIALLIANLWRMVNFKIKRLRLFL